ncbi:hypothetical protein TNCV_2900611 [Trichonephila clavipes]|nr:hypothetical protein TNCV_2900611 [Trichonephila clavipes]
MPNGKTNTSSNVEQANSGSKNCSLHFPSSTWLPNSWELFTPIVKLLSGHSFFLRNTTTAKLIYNGYDDVSQPTFKIRPAIDLLLQTCICKNEYRLTSSQTAQKYRRCD